MVIHKPGKSHQEASLYCPFKLTPALSKLWEEIFVVHLKDHMELFDIIPKH